MGVDFLICSNTKCRDTFPDCGEYIDCHLECGRHWCSMRCAKQDGYKNTDDDCEEQDCIDDGHPDGEHTSCNYCRKEKATDSELLEYALDRLGITRKKLEKQYLKGEIRFP